MKTGDQVRLWLKTAADYRAGCLVADHPPLTRTGTELGIATLERAWHVSTDERVGTELGDAVAQRRSWILALRKGAESVRCGAASRPSEAAGEDQPAPGWMSEPDTLLLASAPLSAALSPPNQVPTEPCALLPV